MGHFVTYGGALAADRVYMTAGNSMPGGLFYNTEYSSNGATAPHTWAINGTGVMSLNGNLLTAPHITGTYGIGADAVGSAASTCSVTGSDTAFTVGFTTGSSLAAGTLCTMTFGSAYASAPRFAAPGATNAASATAITQVYSNATTTTLAVSATSALAASTTYAYHFVLVQ